MYHRSMCHITMRFVWYDAPLDVRSLCVSVLGRVNNASSHHLKGTQVMQLLYASFALYDSIASVTP